MDPIETTRAEGVETRKGGNGRSEGEEALRTLEGGLEKEALVPQFFISTLSFFWVWEDFFCSGGDEGRGKRRASSQRTRHHTSDIKHQRRGRTRRWAAARGEEEREKTSTHASCLEEGGRGRSLIVGGRADREQGEVELEVGLLGVGWEEEKGRGLRMMSREEEKKMIRREQHSNTPQTPHKHQINRSHLISSHQIRSHHITSHFISSHHISS